MATRRKARSAVEPGAPAGVVMAPVGALRAHPENPRTLSVDGFERLKASLAAAPDMLLARPLIALPDGTVFCGNMRLRAVQALGWDTVPVLYADLPPERVAFWMLRDNAAFGEWDERALGELLAELDDGGADLTAMGFSSDELERVMTDPAADLEPGIGEPEYQGELEAPPATVSVGHISFTVERRAYLAWIDSVRLAAGFSTNEVVAELRRRLGL